MAERPDLRQIAVSIAEALDGFERDDLARMLTYVFKEYVVEGAPPVLVSQVDGIDALEGLSFPELIEQLQARLDLPELEHFAVQGDQVMVRVDGVLSAIGGASSRVSPAMRAAPAPRPAAPQATDSGESGRRAALDEAVQRGRGDLAGGRRGVASPPPARGLSINSRPAAGAAPAAPAQPATAAPPTTEAPPPEPETEDPPHGDDDASVRFSLLELD